MISPSNSHYVVSIGGAPFVPPLKTMMQFDSTNNSDYNRRTSMSASRYGHGSKTNHSPTSSPIMPISPLSDSASSSGGSDASSNGGSPTSNNTNWEAAMRYTSALHEHTRRMWEQERLSIERIKLGLPIESSSSSSDSPAKSNTSSSSSGLQKRSTLSGIDSLWRGRRKHSKNNSISEFRS